MPLTLNLVLAQASPEGGGVNVLPVLVLVLLLAGGALYLRTRRR